MFRQLARASRVVKRLRSDFIIAQRTADGSLIEATLPKESFSKRATGMPAIYVTLNSEPGLIAVRTGGTLVKSNCIGTIKFVSTAKGKPWYGFVIDEEDDLEYFFSLGDQDKNAVMGNEWGKTKIIFDVLEDVQKDNDKKTKLWAINIKILD